MNRNERWTARRSTRDKNTDGIGLSFETLEDRRVLSGFYNLNVVAKTGTTFTNIQNSVSINDSGNVAFVAEDNLGPSSIFFNTTPISFVRNFGPELQINNANQIGAVDWASSAGRRARIWNANSPGAQTIIGRSTLSSPPSDHFDVLGSMGTIANDGKMAFAGLESTVWEMHISDQAVDARSLISEVASLPTGTFFRFMAADGDRMVVGSRSSTTKRIVHYDNTLVTTFDTIATTASGEWSDLGVRPGISDDGRIVVFYGDLTAAGASAHGLDPGPGIFAAYDDDDNLLTDAQLIRVAGRLGNGITDPGERQDQGPDFDFDESEDWGFDSFFADVRPSVTSFQDFADPAKGKSATVVFLANDSINSASKAIYSSRVNFFNYPGGAVKVGVEAPIQVVRTGESVAGFGTVSDLNIHDSVNASGTVGFYAASGSSDSVIRADLNYQDQQNMRGRFDPDSPLVDYIAQGKDINSRAGGASDIQQLVMHATVGTLTQSMDRLTNRSAVGIHYIVTRQGAVIQSVPEGKWGHHANNVWSSGDTDLTNKHSIGIELIDNGGHASTNGWFTAEQARVTALLVRDIATRNSIAQQHLLPFPLATTRQKGIGGPNDGDRLPNPPAREAFSVPNVLTVGPPDLTDPFGLNILGTGQVDASAHYQAGQPNSTTGGLNRAMDGFAHTAGGIITHGQVLDRTTGKTDAHPRFFNWPSFMTQVAKPLAFQLNSPANLLVTDNQGRRSGADAVGNVFDEIPGAAFSGPGSHPQTLFVPDPMDGDYAIQVMGTASGSFRLDVFAGDDRGGLLNTAIFGNTTSGQVDQYGLPYTSLGIETSVIQAASNLQPVANDDIAFLAGQSSLDLPVLANDSDPDGNIDSTSVSIVSPPDNGVLAIDPTTGVITYQPNPGFLGHDQFTYRVNDENGLASNDGIATIVVESIPPDAMDDLASASSGVPVSIDVLSNDADPDGAIDPTTLELFSPAQFGQAIVNASTGQIDYTANPGFVGTDRFAYLVRDDSGDYSNEAIVTITVTASPNTVPTVTINSPADGASAAQGSNIDFAGTASDAEDGDLSANLVWTSSLDGMIGNGGSFTSAALSVGTHTITAAVTDSGGLAGSSSITVTVNAPNTVPTVTINSPADGASVVQGSNIDFAGTASDAEDGDLSANLVWTSSLDGMIGNGGSFTSAALSVGTHTITAAVTDSGGLAGSSSITVTVNVVTPPPPVGAPQFILSLDDPRTPGIDVIVADEAAAGTLTSVGITTHADPYSVAGIVHYRGSAGSFPINSTTAISKPAIGAGGSAEMFLNTVNLSFAPGRIIVSVTDSGFDLGSGIHMLTSPISGVTSGRVTFEETIDAGAGQVSNDLGPFGPGAFSGFETSVFGSATPFSLTKTVTIDHQSFGGQITGLGAGGRIRHVASARMDRGRPAELPSSGVIGDNIAKSNDDDRPERVERKMPTYSNRRIAAIDIVFDRVSAPDATEWKNRIGRRVNTDTESDDILNSEL